MKSIAEIIAALNGSEINTLLLFIGAVFVILGVSRFSFWQVVPKYRKLLNRIGIPFLIVGLAMSLLGWLNTLGWW